MRLEVGRALNPKIVEQQLVGGAWMAISHALYETTEPYYPSRDHGAADFNEYPMPGFGNLPKVEIRIIERPARTVLTAPRASARCVPMCRYRPSRMQFSMPSACVSTACR